MKPFTARQIIDVLTANGFVLSRQNGSHRIYTKTSTGNMVPVPVHGGNKPLPIGTFLAIVKQSRLPRSAFIRR